MDEQLVAMEAIRNIEREAMKSQKPQPGLVELMTYLTSKDMKKGICTRNFEYEPCQHNSMILTKVSTAYQ